MICIKRKYSNTAGEVRGIGSVLAVLVLLGTMIICGSLGVSCTRKEPLGPRLQVVPPPEALRDEQTSEWITRIREVARPGYWLVIRGYNSTDNLIVTWTNIPLSHAALFDPEKDQVIEAHAKGVLKTPLETFVKNSHRLLVIKPLWWSDERGVQAVEEARTFVGNKYDFFGIVGLSVEDRFYCSELAFYVYRDYHVPEDHIPRVIEPGQMYLWGEVVWDSRTRD